MWIEVRNRLPPVATKLNKGHWVLVYDTYQSKVFIACRFISRGRESWRLQYGKEINNITHWCPLPVKPLATLVNQNTLYPETKVPTVRENCWKHY